MKGTGKSRSMFGGEFGGEELDKQVVQYIVDSAATCIMTLDADCLTNYRDCSRPLGLANGGTTFIARYGNLTVVFCFDNEWVPVKLYDVTFAPLLSYNPFSLPSLALKGHAHAGKHYGVTLQLKKGKNVHFSRIRKLCQQYGCRQRRRVGW